MTGVPDMLLAALGRRSSSSPGAARNASQEEEGAACRRFSPASLLDRLAAWNRDVEALLLLPSPQDGEGGAAGEELGSGGRPGEPRDAADADADTDAEDAVRLATAALAARFLDCVRRALVAPAPSDKGEAGEERDYEALPGTLNPNSSADEDPPSALAQERDLEAEASRLVRALRRQLGRGAVAGPKVGGRRPVEGGGGGNDDGDAAATDRLRALSEAARAGKNWLRYLLVRRPSSPAGPAAEPGVSAAGAPGGGPRDDRQELQLLPVLRLHFCLLDRLLLVVPDGAEMEHSAGRRDEGAGEGDPDGADPFFASGGAAECARCAALMLFYATFDDDAAAPAPGLPSPAHRSVLALIERVDEDEGESDGALHRFLRYLLSARTSAVAVAVARNVHHFLAAACRHRRPDFASRLLDAPGRAATAAADRIVVAAQVAASPPSSPSQEETRGRHQCTAPWAPAAALWDPAQYDRHDAQRQLPDSGHGPPVTASSEGGSAKSPAPAPAAAAITFTYEAAMVEILSWCSEDSAEELAETHQQQDRRSELALEIVRILYVARFGRNLRGPRAASDPGSPCQAHVLQRRTETMLRLLDLPAAMVEADPLWWECQRSAIALLMDADPSFAPVIARNPRALGTLLGALDRLASETVTASHKSGRSVDPSASAASLTPVLVVLHKLCQANAECRLIAQRHVFPPRPPDDSASDPSTATPGDDSKEPDRPANDSAEPLPLPATNMKPLDAPEGTVRADLIRLMTWHQSHIKRFAGELLWVLCDQDPAGFVRRVGMGNAIVVLGSKGIMDLPTRIFE